MSSPFLGASCQTHIHTHVHILNQRHYSLYLVCPDFWVCTDVLKGINECTFPSCLFDKYFSENTRAAADDSVGNCTKNLKHHTSYASYFITDCSVSYSYYTLMVAPVAYTVAYTVYFPIPIQIHDSLDLKTSDENQINKPFNMYGGCHLFCKWKS